MIRDFVNALYQYRYYPKYLQRRRGRIFLYALLLVLLNLAVTVLVPVSMLEVNFGGVTGAIRKYVPEFSLSGGKLSLPEPIHYAEGSVYISIDTDPSNVVDADSREFRTLEALNDVVVAGNADEIVFKVSAGNDLAARRSGVIRFADHKNLSLSKEDLYGLVPWVRLVIAVGCLLLFLMKFLSFFFWALIIALFASVFSRREQLPLRFGSIFGLSVYARTLPLVVETILSAFGLLFMEAVLLGAVYSVYLLSRVFRVLSLERSGNFAGAGRDREPGGSRKAPDAEGETHDAPHSASDAGEGEVPGGDAGSGGGRGSAGSGGPVPTPKTPDAGTGAGYGFNPWTGGALPDSGRESSPAEGGGADAEASGYDPAEREDAGAEEGSGSAGRAEGEEPQEQSSAAPQGRIERGAPGEAEGGEEGETRPHSSEGDVSRGHPPERQLQLRKERGRRRRRFFRGGQRNRKQQPCLRKRQRDGKQQPCLRKRQRNRKRQRAGKFRGFSERDRAEQRRTE